MKKNIKIRTYNKIITLINSLIMKLTIRGYKISHSKLRKILPNYEEKIMNELILYPYNDREKYEPILCYINTGKYFYLPRFWAEEKIGPVSEKNKIHQKKVVETPAKYWKKKFPLMERQKTIMKKVLPHICEKGGGMLGAGCAAGKTCMSIFLKCKLKCRSLVLTMKDEDLHNWGHEIKKFTYKERGTFHILKGKGSWKKITDKTDFILTTVQTFYKDNEDILPLEILQTIGLVIYDEIHNSATKMFSNCFLKFSPPYIIGLSATPLRSDGLHRMFDYYVGETMYEDNFEYKNDIRLCVTYISPSCKNEDNNEYGLVYNRKGFGGKMIADHNKILKTIVENDVRNNMIVNWILRLKRKHPQYKPLIVSVRVNHLRFLKREIEKSDLNVKCGLIIGNRSKDECEEAKRKDVLLGVYNCVKDAFNVPDINALLFATSVKNETIVDEKTGKQTEKIRQLIGRAGRKKHDVPVQIMHIVDKFGYFPAHYKSCISYYKSNENIKFQSFYINGPDEELPDFCLENKQYIKNEENSFNEENPFYNTTYIMSDSSSE